MSPSPLMRTIIDTACVDANDGNAVVAVNSVVIGLEAVFQGVVNIDVNSFFFQSNIVLDRSVSTILGTEIMGDSLANIQSITNRDVEITDPTKGLILTSPDSTRWRILVDNAGVISANEII